MDFHDDYEDWYPGPRSPGFLTNFKSSDRFIYEKAIAEHWEKFPYDCLEFKIVDKAYAIAKLNYMELHDCNALHFNSKPRDTGNFWRIFDRIKEEHKTERELRSSGKLKMAVSFYDNE